MKASLSRILAIAQAEVGYIEQPVNLTKYGKWYGMNGQPWCAMFISWLFAQAGDAETIGKFAYTPTFAQSFKNRGEWGTVPKVGSIAFFNFPDSVDRIQHVGIVQSFDNHTVTCIEGNTSSGSTGSQSNGGQVARRARLRNSSIVGYGYPSYAAESVVYDYIYTVDTRVSRLWALTLFARARKALVRSGSLADGRTVWVSHKSRPISYAIVKTGTLFGLTMRSTRRDLGSIDAALATLKDELR